MKKYILLFLFVFALSSSVYADDIVELDENGHISLVDRVRNTKDKFLPETVQSGPSDSEFLNQIIESSVAKIVSVSSSGWSDLLSVVYDLIGVSGSVIDSATVVTQQAIDKINDWFDLSDDGFVKTAASWHTDMSHIYNLKGFSDGSYENWYPALSGFSFYYQSYTFYSFDSRYVPEDCYYTISQNRLILARKGSGGVPLYVRYNNNNGNYSASTSMQYAYSDKGYYCYYFLDCRPNNFDSDSAALEAFFGSDPAVGYNGFMYLNTDPSYNPDIFIRSLPSTNWQQVSNNRYNLVGSDPTEDSINDTFNSNNPVYTYINPSYNFEIPYALTHGNSTVYDFVLSDDYDFSNIEFSPSEYEIDNGVMIVQDVWEASPGKIKAYILAILSLSVAFLFIRS